MRTLNRFSECIQQKLMEISCHIFFVLVASSSEHQLVFKVHNMFVLCLLFAYLLYHCLAIVFTRKSLVWCAVVWCGLVRRGLEMAINKNATD